MHRKYLELNLNFEEIRKRISLDKGKHKNIEWAKLLQVSPSLISQVHPKVATKASKSPSLEYVIAVARFTGKPVEWYLYGETNPPPIRKLPQPLGDKPTRLYHPLLKDPKFWSNWSDEDIDVCAQVKQIMDSNHPVLKPLMIQAISHFQQTIKAEKRRRSNKKS